MNRLQALLRALDSFGFEEQATACRRLADSGSIAFKDDSIQWQQWSVDASGKVEDEAFEMGCTASVRSHRAALLAASAPHV